MAKLSAHGYEVARLVKRWNPRGTEYIVHLSFRSDGHVLRRLVAQNIHDTTYGASPHHDYGWKLYKKFQPDPKRNIVERVRKLAESYRDQSADNGNLIEYKGAILS